MRVFARIRIVSLALASVGLLLPQSAAVAADPTDASGPRDIAAVQDATLAAGGVLQGQVLSPEGLPIAQAPVILWASGHRIAATETDADGGFSFAGLRGGNYIIVAAENSSEYRLWTEHTAPPHAGQRVLIVGGGDATRAQSGGGGWTWAPRTTTLALAAFAGGIVAGGVIGQQNGSGS